MDFTFEEQQLAFAEAIRKFLMIEAAPEWLREIWETTASGRSAALRAKLADQGLTALSVPEDFGGIGVGDLDWALVQKEIGYYAIPDSLSDTAYLGVYLLKQLPAALELKREWLPRVAAGEARIAIGHPINPFVADAQLADLLLLWHEHEIHALRSDQVELRFNASIDVSRRLYQVQWTPSEASCICPARIGESLWAGLVDRAALASAAQLLGLAQRMLDLGIDHAAQRKQFGRAIGSFQAVKHQLADVAVKIEFADPVMHRAAYALEKGLPNRSAHVSHARLAASEAAAMAARASLQVHGAIGYTWEADLQMFMKRVWALDASWGSRAFHKSRIAELIFAAESELGPGTSFG